MTLAPAVIETLHGHGLDVPVVVGGIVPRRDIPRLHELGVVEVLTPGASEAEVVAAMHRAMHGRPATRTGGGAAPS